jgi:hypothetical protein
LEEFLSFDWQHAINQRSERIFSSQRYEPHPNLDLEVEIYFQRHPLQRRIEYGVFGMLTLANTYMIAKALQAIRSSKTRAAKN